MTLLCVISVELGIWYWNLVPHCEDVNYIEYEPYPNIHVTSLTFDERLRYSPPPIGFPCAVKCFIVLFSIYFILFLLTIFQLFESYFTTLRGPFIKQQVLNLQELGVESWVLDKLQPIITISEW